MHTYTCNLQCMYINVYGCVRVCVFVYVRMCVCVYSRTCVLLNVSMNAHLRTVCRVCTCIMCVFVVHKCTYICVCVYVCMHVSVQSKYTCTYTYAYKCKQTNSHSCKRTLMHVYIHSMIPGIVVILEYIVVAFSICT